MIIEKLKDFFKPKKQNALELQKRDRQKKKEDKQDNQIKAGFQIYYLLK
ncbi:16369_t:CDS:1, partial [Racocetra persica]